MSIVKPLFFFAALFLLSSCAHTPKYFPSTLSWQQRQQQLSALINWQFRGDMILKVPKHKWRANVYWQQQADVYRIKLFGPFGFGAVNIDGRSGQVSLKDSNGHVFSANSPELLMQRQCGWSLPISSLYYWVRGLPSPAPIDYVAYDDYHRIAHLEQQGWQIDYIVYQHVQQLELPQEITFTQAGFSASLKIEGDSWQVNR